MKLDKKIMGHGGFYILKLNKRKIKHIHLSIKTIKYN